MSVRKFMNGADNIRLLQHEAEPQVILRRGGTIRIVSFREINWVESDAHRCIFHLGRTPFPIREQLSTVEQVLPSAVFVKLNRSLLVNVERIRQIASWMRGQTKITMMDGTYLVCRGGDKILTAVLAEAAEEEAQNQEAES